MSKKSEMWRRRRDARLAQVPEEWKEKRQELERRDEDEADRWLREATRRIRDAKRKSP